MTQLKRKYLWSWAIAGVMVPVLLLVIGFFMPKGPEQTPFENQVVTPTQQRLAVAFTVLYPAIYVDIALSLLVTDGGGDSGGLVAGSIIFAISAFLNAGLYFSVGLISWPIVEHLRPLLSRVKT